MLASRSAGLALLFRQTQTAADFLTGRFGRTRGSDFVDSVLSKAEEKFERRYELLRQGYDLGKIAEKVAMVLSSKVNIPQKQISAFCHRHSIKKLSLFGSVLRGDFSSSNDVDVLVEFESDKKIGLIRLSCLELELGEIFGRKVDLNNPGFLSKLDYTLSFFNHRIKNNLVK